MYNILVPAVPPFWEGRFPVYISTLYIRRGGPGGRSTPGEKWWSRGRSPPGLFFILRIKKEWVLPKILSIVCSNLSIITESTSLTTTELFDSPLNCLMFNDITYCSAFPEDIIFRANLDSFRFR